MLKPWSKKRFRFLTASSLQSAKPWKEKAINTIALKRPFAIWLGSSLDVVVRAKRKLVRQNYSWQNHQGLAAQVLKGAIKNSTRRIRGVDA
jgi:hypothetical protein